MNRRESRIKAMQILYIYDFNKYSIEEAIEVCFDEEEKDILSVTFAQNCIKELSQIDQLINDNLENYRIERLNLVDKAIIRLATSELLSDTPKSIVINEALEITKEFTDVGDRKAVRFNNRILDKISQNLKK